MFKYCVCLLVHLFACPIVSPSSFFICSSAYSFPIPIQFYLYTYTWIINLFYSFLFSWMKFTVSEKMKHCWNYMETLSRSSLYSFSNAESIVQFQLVSVKFTSAETLCVSFSRFSSAETYWKVSAKFLSAETLCCRFPYSFSNAETYSTFLLSFSLHKQEVNVSVCSARLQFL